jgi:phage portal protein BeeE
VTGYLPWSLEYKPINLPTPADLQLVELQKQVTLELANLFGLDPEDLGVSTTSRTYQNAVDRRVDRVNEALAPYMRALTDRLSMGDVTRRGHRVVLDLDDHLKANPTERAEFYAKMIEIGAMDAADVRAAEDLPDRPTSARQDAPGAPQNGRRVA